MEKLTAKNLKELSSSEISKLNAGGFFGNLQAFHEGWTIGVGVAWYKVYKML